MRVLNLCVLLLTLSGCPPKPPVVIVSPLPPRVDLRDAAAVDMATDAAERPMSACAPAAKLKQEDICDGFFTRGGLSCARCSNVKGCLDEVLAMYCATGPCALDSACTYVLDPTLKSGRTR